MTATAHALVAGAIARAVPNPYLAIPLAITSHFIMDAIPHWDIGADWRKRSKTVTGALAISETVLGITLAYFLFRGKVETPLLLSTIVASELPDWLEAPWYIFFARRTVDAPKKHASHAERFFFWLYKTVNLRHAKAPLPWGIISQVIVVAAVLLVLR